MVEKLISEYINRMNKDDVLNFADKNGIILTVEELDIIYINIKENWRTLIYGNPRVVLDNIKEKVNPITFSKMENLYIFFRDKYKNYL